MAWNGAGAWLIFLQPRQQYFYRTLSTTFHWRGITSSVRVTLAKLAQAIAAASADRSPRARAAGTQEDLALALAGKSSHPILATARSAVSRLGEGVDLLVKHTS